LFAEPFFKNSPMKQEYIAPVLTVVSFRVERGFETSGVVSSPFDFDMFITDNDRDLNQAASYQESHWNW